MAAASVKTARRITFLVGLLYMFLVAISLMGGAFKLLGKDAAHGLFAGIENPFAGLAVGILATVLVQSSSVTTATIVALVGSGELALTLAVPMVMGANIGTTITNTLVSIGHAARKAEFRRAFAAATVHDFFNLMVVAALFPLELATGFLAKLSGWMVSGVSLSQGEKQVFIVKAWVKAGAGWVKGSLEGLGLGGGPLAAVLLILALAAIFFALYWMTRTMRKLLAGRAEAALNAALSRSGLLAILLGIGLTVAVQSSSITTSLLVPLSGAGILHLENAFPVMLGANIGTTITGFIASVATDYPVRGLQIALVHFLFNLTGILLVYPWAATRRIPIRLARRLAAAAVLNRWMVAVYVLGAFVLVPLLGWLLFG